VPAALDPRIHAARGHVGQITSAANMRSLTEGSALLEPVPGTREPLGTQHLVPSTPAKVQDAYSLRCMPQVHGPAREAVAYVRNVLLAELNSANDNPLIFPASTESNVPGTESDDTAHSVPGTSYSVLSGGNFHGAPLSVAADFLGIALCGLATISERRQARMVDPAAHGGLFPAFLIDNGGLNSGFMIIQYTSAALASENKSLAHPASVDTIPTSANTEDHVSMGPIAARHARAIVANTARVLALEALMAAQAIDFRLRSAEYRVPSADSNSDHSVPGTQHSALGKGTRRAYDIIRAGIPFLERDQDMQPYIASAISLVTSCQLSGVLRG